MTTDKKNILIKKLKDVGVQLKKVTQEFRNVSKKIRTSLNKQSQSQDKKAIDVIRQNISKL